MTALPDGYTGIAVLYGAKSTRDPHKSIPTQLDDARTFAGTLGYKVAGEYSDEAASAYTGNRGQGLTDAKDHAIRLAQEYGEAAVVVQHSDRLARGDGITADHLAEVWFSLRRNGVRLRSAEDDHNLEDALRVVLIGERNNEDSVRKATSVANGLNNRKRHRGLHVGGRKKFGYRYQRNPDGSTVADAPMLPDEPEATIWREQVFRAAMDGVPARQIALRLNDAGVPTTQGGRWHPSSVRKMLLDPFYAGKLKDANGELLDGMHDGLVSWDEWTALQKLRAEQPHNRKGGRPTGNPALFTNRHLRCGECGGTMGYRRQPNRTPGSYWEVYKCVEHERDARLCSQTPVQVRAVEEAARRALAADTSVSERAHELGERNRAELELVKAQRSDALRLVLQSQAALEKADRLFATLDPEDYTRLTTRAKSEQAGAEAQLTQLDNHLAELEARTEHVTEQQVIMDAMEELRTALSDGPVERARMLLRRAYPTVTLKGAQGRLWLDLQPSPAPQVTPRYSDELGPLYAGELVRAGGSVTTGHPGLKWCPVVTEVLV